jgi:hypothetical protein
MELSSGVQIHFVADWGAVEGMLGQLEAHQLYGIDSEWADTASQRHWYVAFILLFCHHDSATL